MIGIARVWNECRKRFPVRLDIAVRIFIKPNHERNATEYGKDLLDCTLRGMRVVRAIMILSNDFFHKIILLHSDNG